MRSLVQNKKYLKINMNNLQDKINYLNEMIEFCEDENNYFFAI